MLAAFGIAAARDGRLRAVFCGPDSETLPVPAHLRSRIRVLGLRDDVAAVMSATDIGCLSSRSGESLPTVLIEFMACQRPCVSTDVGDAAAIVGDLGRVVPPRDAAALAEAILALSALSREHRSELGRLARDSIARRFEIGAVAARHAALWRELIAGAARS
jgi:glycosyltransferase involved in cell wall biosynthesis